MEVIITRSNHGDVPGGTRGRAIVAHAGGFGVVITRPFGVPARVETRCCWFAAEVCAHADYQPLAALALPPL